MTTWRYSLFLLLFLPIALSARGGGDDLYMPREVKRAYDRGTRSPDGMPGARYWQNAADYDMRVRINPSQRLLTGSATISYRNNSPDTLGSLVLKLHQNMNRRGAARLFPLGEQAVTEGVHIGKLTVDGQERNFLPDNGQASISGGNCIVTMPEALPPGESTEIDVEWNFTIPVNTGEGGGNPRMGTYENGAIFIAYWFPRVAVYDDVFGWDMHSYNGEHEFYNDYGSYRVAIDVPERYGVWATGMLQNADDVLREPALSRYRMALESDSVVRIVNEAEAQGQSPYIAEDGRCTWEFAGEQLPDFAFGMARGYCWDGTGARVGRSRVFVDAAYDPQSKSFATAVEEGSVTVRMMSAARPGIPFPYPGITVFNGHYGMEFPMIVNDGEFPNRILNVYVHSHEIAHSYFPFMVGINETRYAWMDEGMAYFLPIDVQKRLSNYDHMIRAARAYERFAGTEKDYPLWIPSTASEGDDLQVIGYLKPAIGFAVLREMLGEERFDEALKVFIGRWTAKHPLPWDFFNTFNTVAAENLNWFWSGWFLEPGYPDLAIASVENEGSLSTVTVRRVGSMPVPVHLKITMQGGESRDVVKSAEVWKDGAEEMRFRIDHDVPITEVHLGGGWIPDSHPQDNAWKP
ncbi:M1 family metallopeptidase [bacterium]|nr:M1 family metallopeptidase [bacterium]